MVKKVQDTDIDQSMTSAPQEGKSFDLYIVQYIVQAHGGTVRAKNDGGLVIELALPCEEDEHE